MARTPRIPMYATVFTVCKSYVDVRFMMVTDARGHGDRLQPGGIRSRSKRHTGHILERHQEAFNGRHYLIGIDRIPASSDVLDALADDALDFEIADRMVTVAVRDETRTQVDHLRQEIGLFQIVDVSPDADYVHVRCVHGCSGRIARTLTLIDHTTHDVLAASEQRSFCPDSYRMLSNEGFDRWRLPREALGHLSHRLVTARLDEMRYHQPVLGVDLLAALVAAATEK